MVNRSNFRDGKRTLYDNNFNSDAQGVYLSILEKICFRLWFKVIFFLSTGWGGGAEVRPINTRGREGGVASQRQKTGTPRREGGSAVIGGTR